MLFIQLFQLSLWVMEILGVIGFGRDNCAEANCVSVNVFPISWFQILFIPHASVNSSVTFSPTAFSHYLIPWWDHCSSKSKMWFECLPLLNLILEHKFDHEFYRVSRYCFGYLHGILWDLAIGTAVNSQIHFNCILGYFSASVRGLRKLHFGTVGIKLSICSYFCRYKTQLLLYSTLEGCDGMVFWKPHVQNCFPAFFPTNDIFIDKILAVLLRSC